jgi:hypothetical protein
MDRLIDRRTDTASASVSSQFLFLCVFWTGTSPNGLFGGPYPTGMLKWTYPPSPGFDQFLFLSDFWTETSTGGLFDGPPDAAASYGLERVPLRTGSRASFGRDISTSGVFDGPPDATATVSSTVGFVFSRAALRSVPGVVLSERQGREQKLFALRLLVL